MKSVAIALASLLAAAAIGVGMWQLGWFVEAKNTDRRTQVNDLSQGRQQALTSKVLRDIRTIRDIDTQEQTEAVAAQRVAIVDGICDSAGLLSGSVTLPTSAQGFINQECY